MGVLINDVSARASYVATAGQTVFALSFVCFADSDLQVYKNGALLVLLTDYTVQNAGLSSGLQVTLLSGAALNDAIVVVRAVPYNRTTEFPLTGPFQIVSLNTFLAKLVAMIQQVRDTVGRSPQLGLSDTDGSGAYDAKVNRLTNLGAPVLSTDAVRKAELDAATVAAGNVPVPTVGDTGKFLGATGVGVFLWRNLVSTFITDSTAAGRAMLTAATAAAQTALLSTFIASGGANAKGMVPAPGASAGTTKFLREDASWQVPPVTTPAGLVKQIVSVGTGAVASGSTLIPYDDTIPQQTEGDQYLTATITPTNATSILEIEVQVQVAVSAANYATVALFQDATAGALVATGFGGIGTAIPHTIRLLHYMVAGTTSATTFKVRGGMDSSGTMTFNGLSGARKYGSVALSRITIREIL